MLVSIYVLLILVCFAMMVVSLIKRTGSGQEEGMAILFLLAIIFFITCLFSCRNQDINEESRKYYSITNVKIENDKYMQVIITEDPEIKKMSDITNESIVYPDDTIICKYNFLPKKGLVNWQNGDVNYYEIIDKDNPLYEKAKKEVKKVVIN